MPAGSVPVVATVGTGEPTVVTHRVVAMNSFQGKPIFQTQGDANNAPDEKWVRQVQIRGVAWYAVPYLGYVTSAITGEQRLNFGQVSLLSGISFVPVTIGLFGIGEILASAEEQGIGYVENISAKLGLTDVFQALRELRKRLRLVLSNAIIGFFFGVLPGHGATAASFLGYGLARQYSSNKENFGKGEISGIMGPQSAADSAGVASLVPMITLGIPGSPTSAVIMAGLFIWGLQPGPVLFIQHPDFVWGLIASIYLGHLLTFILCLLAVPLLAMIMRVPYAIITPFIVVISIIGSYSLNNSILDVFITVVFGLIGYWLRKMKYPLAPLVVALVLGDSTERELRKALIAGHGSPLYFFNSGLSTVLILAAVVLVLIPLVRTIRARRRGAAPPAAVAHP